MIVFLAALLIAGAVLFTFRVRREDLPETDSGSAAAYLEARRDRIQEGLRDLEFEFRVAKLSEADYRRSRAELERDLERVSAELESRRAGEPQQAPAAPPAPGPSAKRAGRVCPHCGAEFERELKFCGECGKPMKGDAV